MKNKILLLVICLGSFPIVTSCRKVVEEEQTKTTKNVFTWDTFRGVNVGCDIKEEDVEDLALSGANLMRFSMPMCTLMEMEAPYALRTEAFRKLDSVLDWGEKHGISVLIDPHRYPGTKHQWTMLGNDPFWQDFKWHNILIKFWDTVATRYANRGKVIAGYDLLNEPEVPLTLVEGSPQDVGLLYKKLTRVIRKKDSVHTIVYALPRVYDSVSKKMQGYHQGITMIDIPEDDNICIETHTYFPKEFTHQNIWEPGIDIPYPVTLDSIFWDRELLEKEQRALIDYSIKNPSVPILVGEFSCPRWTGQNGLQYVKDVIEIAEKYNWSWAYHAYREASVWDPEMSISDRNDSVRSVNAPRWKLLKAYFQRN